MKEDAFVVSTQESFARVKVEQRDICDTCSARSLCLGQRQKDGTIIVRNPLSAQVGDSVTIDVPDAGYSRALILFFSTLLLASLLGMLLGYLFSLLFSLHPSYSSLGGFLAGLFLGSVFLSLLFRKRKTQRLYPVIIQIKERKNTVQCP